MDIDRRSPLSATACLAMTKLVGHPSLAGAPVVPTHPIASRPSTASELRP